jgi:ribonuclease HI
VNDTTTLKGLVFLGDSRSDLLRVRASVSGSLIPNTTNLYDLGSESNRWRDLFLSGSSLHIGKTNDESLIGFNDTTDTFFIDSNVGTPVPTRRNMLSILNTGNVGMGTNSPDTKLEVVGTISGSTVLSSGKIAGSGALVIGGAVTLKGVTSCTALQSASNGALSCNNAVYLQSSTGSLQTFFNGLYLRTSTGSLQTFFNGLYLRTSTGALSNAFKNIFIASSTGALKLNFSSQFVQSSTGSLQTFFNKRYVSVAGDTMTGGLLIVNGGPGTQSVDAGVLLEVAGLMSGKTLRVQDQINLSGALVIKKTAGSATGNILVVDTKGLVYDATNKRVGIGNTQPQGLLHAKTASRSTVFDASNGLTWHDLIIQNPNNSLNSAVGLAFELNGTYHTNAATGIAAVKSTDGSDYGADMVFITRPQAAVAAERMRLTSAGFFGIGTTAPGAPLVVQKGNDNAGDNALRIQSTSSTEFGFFEPNAASDYLRMGYYNGASFANVFLEGSVGINTSSPDAKLDVESAQDTEHIRFTDSTNADSVGLYSGQGTPIGTVTAQLGSMYFDSTGGKVYIKAVGDSTNTGWQEIQTGSGSLQMARMNKTVGTQNIYGGQVRQKVYLDAISFDVGGIANVVSGTTGSGRITIKKAGKYLVTSSWQIGSNCAASDRVDTAIYKNNSLVELSEQQCSTQIVESPVTQIFDLAVNDYLEMFVGIGTANTTSTGLHASPYLSVVQLNVSPGADIAELYGSYDKLNPGDVVVLDPARHSMVKKSTSAYESGLVGIISTAPGMVLGGDYTPPQGAKTVVLGLAGRVPVKVTTENGRILPGDLLTSSSKPGFAMKATGPGPVVGQALEGFNGVEAQEGLIMAFINNSRIGPAGLGTGSGTLALSASATLRCLSITKNFAKPSAVTAMMPGTIRSRSPPKTRTPVRSVRTPLRARGHQHRRSTDVRGGDYRDDADHDARDGACIPDARDGESGYARMIVINTDGGARGNPGPAASAYVIAEDGRVLAEKGTYLGNSLTNNWAEYQGLIQGLEKARELGLTDADVEVRMDSELIVKQMNGEYKVKHPDLKGLYMAVQELLEDFAAVRFVHVRRAENKEAKHKSN